jgi:predicted homoserine dehydrogenase-like protein
MTYGEAASVTECRQRRYLPMGLVEGCRLLRDVPQDQALTCDDIQVPAGRVADQLYEEQCRMFTARS